MPARETGRRRVVDGREYSASYARKLLAARREGWVNPSQRDRFSSYMRRNGYALHDPVNRRAYDGFRRTIAKRKGMPTRLAPDSNEIRSAFWKQVQARHLNHVSHDREATRWVLDTLYEDADDYDWSEFWDEYPEE